MTTLLAPLELLKERYGDAADIAHDTAPVTWNETLRILLSHRSIRAYEAKSLPDGTLETLIAAAQSASTSSNLQTWSVVAVESPDRKAKLAELAGNQRHIQQCPLFLVWLADLARLTHVAQHRGLPSDGLDYLEMFVMATVDAALAAQNAAIAAESLGLGVVYIGGMRNQPEAVAKTLNLPPHLAAVFGLCVGYAAPDDLPAIKPRLPQSAVLHRETYSLETQDAAIAHYNAVMADFYAAQQMNVSGDWAAHSIQRVASVEALKGRDRLRQALNALGFALR